MIEIKQIEATQTYPLRIKILRKGIRKNFHFLGDNKSSTFHLGAFQKNTIIGIVTFIQKEHPKLNGKLSYQLRGMAVSKKHQNKGVGKLLIEKSYHYLREKKCSLVWCNAREVALGFYENLSFKKVGKSFQIPGIGKHYSMYLEFNTNTI